MPIQTAVPLASRRRALLTLVVAAALLAFNYGSSIETVSEAALAVAAYLVVGYLTLTAMDLLFDRFLWRN
ncbi:hypothetical protein Htur_2424 [Haloterrigena turkmenica DSM 5511]|uniref:Uncharacterized protein n=1 Tax=Haloterrigena turkmenica (strain ATCC 51198 / DSM 5511 / JCM 9101 / NCIMB 13204 / VKM B-1734 / 4k) TaxID=543526 RepID=D2RVA1_HALTV|nr:hypothetical protein [Haloterrigena turkmenica]ADB61302.1 hypothetical protein Htur_2424 [Haloterrigena turkmenica DSM 5511]